MEERFRGERPPAHPRGLDLPSQICLWRRPARFRRMVKAQIAREVPREAFLFRRLQTMPETRGRFSLNAELPIPFDGRGRMEVDLLCAETGS